MAQKKSTTAKSTPSKSKTASKPKNPKEATAVPQDAPQPIRREVGGVLFLLLALFVAVGYFNTEGSVIAFCSRLLKGLLGWGYWLTAPAFILAAFILFFHHNRPVEYRVVSAVLLPILFSALVDLLLAPLPEAGTDLRVLVNDLFVSGQELGCGGVLGGLISVGLRRTLSVYGALPLLLIALAVFGILAVRGGFKGLFQGFHLPEHREYPAPAPAPAKEPAAAEAFHPLEELTRSVNEPEPRRVQQTRPAQDAASQLLDIPFQRKTKPAPAPVELSPEEELQPKRAKVRRRKDPEAQPELPELVTESAPDPAPVLADKEEEIVDGFRTLNPLSRGKTAGAPARPVAVSAEISDPPKGKKARKEEVAEEAKAMAEAITLAPSQSDYQFPPTSLLRTGTGAAIDAREEIAVNRERLEAAIRSFGINTSVVNVTRGPTVTRYDIELEQGVKLSRVTNLAEDLALALGVINVRIAPIPDKISTVGIEVPNKIVSTVYLRDIIESPRFTGAKSKLSFALGRDIGGECIVGNISKLPHLLIAGTTGSGKSVCMNSLILSLLFKARPDEVRLIMIDPKMVELGIYNGIPHLYVPVVTDPKKAAGALQWSVVEMLKRYRAFSEVGVRDLENYNKHCIANGEEPMPQVVIVIDELADLMLVASKEVEESICRVAQMGRAAGMHLVIATQRPSADVITGLMKANIPSRIAFAVSSAMESRIILDQGGAEKLVGMGDMLFSPVGSGKPTRIQGAFVSDEEREDVIQFIKESAGASQQPQANSEILEFMDKAIEEKAGSDSAKGGAKEDSGEVGGYDEMLPQAVEVVLETGSCSVSMLQRRVKLGYSRAARIVDQMEELGVVGPYEGAKPRAVVIDRQGWHDLQVQLGLIQDDMALAAEMSKAADQQNG